jgi:subtilisin family serine protease
MTDVETKLESYLSADWIKKNQQTNIHAYSVLKIIESDLLQPAHAYFQYDYLTHAPSHTQAEAHYFEAANASITAESIETTQPSALQNQNNSQNTAVSTPLSEPENSTESTLPIVGFDFQTPSGTTNTNAAEQNNVSSLLESLFSTSASFGEIHYQVDTSAQPTDTSTSTLAIEHLVQVQSLHLERTSANEALAAATPTQNPNWDNASGWGEAHTDKALELLTGKPIIANSPNHSSALGAMGFNAAWDNGYTGKGVVIADVDTGIDLNNTQLISNLHISNKSWNFINQTNDVQDDNGHGTITAEELAAGPNFDDLIDGGAYDAQLMVLKALDAFGKGSDASVAQAIEYAVDHGADIINLSLGQYTPDALLFSALRYADAHDVIVVAASGNSGSSAPNFPAAYAKFLPDVIAVGATQISQNSIDMSEFSNHAGSDTPYNFVDAIGVDILGMGLNGQEAYWSGTSMATPYISAEAAILKQANPNASAADIVQAITNTAEKIQLSAAGLHFDLSAAASNQSFSKSTTQCLSDYHLETTNSHYSQYVPSEQYY